MFNTNRSDVSCRIFDLKRLSLFHTLSFRPDSWRTDSDVLLPSLGIYNSTRNRPQRYLSPPWPSPAGHLLSRSRLYLSSSQRSLERFESVRSTRPRGSGPSPGPSTTVLRSLLLYNSLTYLLPGSLPPHLPSQSRFRVTGTKDVSTRFDLRQTQRLRITATSTDPRSLPFPSRKSQ